MNKGRCLLLPFMAVMLGQAFGLTEDKIETDNSAPNGTYTSGTTGGHQATSIRTSTSAWS